MKKFFITKKKTENGKRLIRVYKTRNGEPVFLGYTEFGVFQSYEIQKAFQLLVKIGEIPKKYSNANYYDVCDKYRILELPY